MSAKTVAAFLCGVMVASTGTAAALTKGQIFRLKLGDEAKYGKVTCQSTHVAPYSAFSVSASAATRSSTGRARSACSAYAA